MNDDIFSLEVEGLASLQGWLRQLLNLASNAIFTQALLECSLVIEENAKRNLQEMIYSHPETWYHRKKGAGLFGATQATGRLSQDGDIIETGVESRKKYAIWVHMGTGIYAVNGDGRKTPWVFEDEDGKFHWTVGQEPKPYLSKALQDSRDKCLTIMSNAMLKIKGGEG